LTIKNRNQNYKYHTIQTNTHEHFIRTCYLNLLSTMQLSKN
jgi:hypothetical protein